MPTKLEKEIAKREQEPTSAEDWGKKTPTKQGFVAEMPSGNIARIRRTLDMPVLLQSGKIPNPLRGIVQGMIESGTTEFPPEAQDMRVVSQLFDLLNDTCVRCFVEPRVSAPPRKMPGQSEEDYEQILQGWVPELGTISVFDIDVEDKMYVFSLAQGAAADIANFREITGPAMAGLSTGEGLRSEAKPAGGANREQRRATAKRK